MKVVRIGGASGFWGDSSVGAPQLVARGQVNYLVFDYLAELTMSILAAARTKDPNLGYATDFVTVTMKAILKDVVAQGIRVVSNAGGVNPQACAQAIEALAAEQGLSVQVAVIEGDDVMPLLPELREGLCEMQSGAPLPAKVLTANAYLGALPIKQALDAGAQIVITGRCVDSAVTLGALMHEFSWAADDYDRLAQGSLAGHIIECGCQATGGLHTDWEDVPDWPHIGYPVIECHEDGSFVVTKPADTGGLVNTAVIAEQMLYEIGDPRRYLLPDVICDFSQVTLQQEAADRVRVRGALGLAPGPQYKVSATYLDGFRCSAQLTIVGIDAARKARRTGEAILERTRELLQAQGLADYSRSLIEVLGSEQANFGPQARTGDVREAVLRLAVTHPQKAALELFAREIAPAGTSWSPGTTGADGRPRPAPAIKQFAFLLDKQRLQPRVLVGDSAIAVAVPHGQAAVPAPDEAPKEATLAPAANWVEVPLLQLAWGRSGDKGDSSNIGIIARQPEWLPLLRAQLTEPRVREWLSHRVHGSVTRYEVPGIHALNFLCTEALGGGGMASLRNDPLGKGMAQILLAMPVRVPPDWVNAKPRTPTFRHATLSDAGRCFEIEITSYEGDEAATLAKITKRIAEYPQGFLVMELEGQLIGFINSGCAYEVAMSDESFKELVGHDAAAPNVVIMSVVIDPAFQGRGWASLMMRTFVEQMRKARKQTIHLMCKERHVGLYTRQGYRYVKPSASDHGGMSWHEMVMEL